MGHHALIMIFMWAMLVLFNPVIAQQLPGTGTSANKSSPAIYHASRERKAIKNASNNKTAELVQVVVTGTRTEKPILESPVRTEVVNRIEIEKTHARDLREALEDVPGLLIKPIHGKTGFEVWMQGMTADQVLIVIDSEPVTPSTGSAMDLTQIGSMDIQQIEIIKGATSALYGSNAMGGVINVITRKPDQPLAYSLTLDGGSYGDKNLSGNGDEINARNIAASLAVKRSVGYVQFYGSRRDNDGYTLDHDSPRSEGATGSKTNLNLRLAWTPDDNTEVYIAPRYYREDVSNNLANFIPGIGEVPKKKFEEGERFSTTIGAQRNWSDGSRVQGWLLADNWSNETQQDVLATPEVDQQRNAEIDLYRAEVQWDQPWGEDHLFTSGILLGQSTLNQYQQRPGEVRAIEVDNKNQRNIEAYLQDDIFIGQHWELVPGFRVQHDSDFGFYAAPKINAMVSPDWFTGIITNIRMGVGRGYRVPHLKERFFIFDHSHLGYMVIGGDVSGSNNLQPESSDSYQLGIEFARPGEFHADITLFHNRIKNLIDTRFNAEESAARGLNIYVYENFARAVTQGVELSGNVNLGRFTPRGSYTLLDSEDLDTGKTLAERPRHQVKLGVDWENKAWATVVTLRGVYQSEEFFDAENLIESPAWTTWDLKLTQRIGKNFKVFGGIDNLADEHRDPADHHDLRPEAGRFVYLGLSLEY